MGEVQERVREQLFAMQDTGYRDFHSRLIPNVAPERIIGVRTPELRRFAKAFGKTEDAAEFLKALPHHYYDENNLHAFLIEGIRDYDTCVGQLERFLPYVDNWATCDLMSPKVLGRHKEKLYGQICLWLRSKDTYTVRFALGLLMRYYLDEDFKPEYLELASGVRCGEYYIDMMTAWYFATALAKRYEETLPYLTQRRLPVWVHNKAIQKAVESSRITAEQKRFLRTLRIREKQEG